MKNLINKYQVFIKYLLVAGISFVIDIGLFTIFNTFIGMKIVIATIIARIISSFINFLLNKNKVFNNEDKIGKSIFKYYLLVIIQMSISALVVDNLAKIIPVNPTIIKAPTEFILFICNYLIQKLFIFKRSDK